MKSKQVWMKCRFQVRDVGFIGEDILFVGIAIRCLLTLRYVVCWYYDKSIVGEAISLPPALTVTIVFGRMISSPTEMFFRCLGFLCFSGG